MVAGGGEETDVLCRTAARREKERAIRNRFSGRIEKALAGLAKRVAEGKWKDRHQIERRWGRIQARPPQVADGYERGVGQEESGLRVQGGMLQERRAWREARAGAYRLRTNWQAESAQPLGTKYIPWTEVEAAFRARKSEWSIRPWFHPRERRGKAHILAAFLG